MRYFLALIFTIFTFHSDAQVDTCFTKSQVIKIATKITDLERKNAKYGNALLFCDSIVQSQKILINSDSLLIANSEKTIRSLNGTVSDLQIYKSKEKRRTTWFIVLISSLALSTALVWRL